MPFSQSNLATLSLWFPRVRVFRSGRPSSSVCPPPIWLISSPPPEQQLRTTLFQPFLFAGGSLLPEGKSTWFLALITPKTPCSRVRGCCGSLLFNDDRFPHHLFFFDPAPSAFYISKAYDSLFIFHSCTSLSWVAAVDASGFLVLSGPQGRCPHSSPPPLCVTFFDPI